MLNKYRLVKHLSTNYGGDWYVSWRLQRRKYFIFWEYVTTRAGSYLEFETLEDGQNSVIKLRLREAERCTLPEIVHQK